MVQELIDVIVPVYNEEAGLPGFFQRLTALPLNIHPIFIDNASTDNSLTMLKQLEGVTVIAHQANEGYGASLRDGIRKATARKIIIIDADCEYAPEVIPELVEQLDSHDVVFTSRFLGKSDYKMSFLKMAGNKIISKFFNLLFEQTVTDLYTGSKGFQRRVVKDLPMERNGFEHVLEVAAKLARQGINIQEIPVEFRLRRTGVSKMSHFSETIKYLYFLFFYYFTISKSDRKSVR